MEQASVSGSPFIVRPATDDDLNFVRKTWLVEHSQQGSDDWIDMVGGGDVYFKEHARCRDAALERGAVIIACRPAVPTGICGFAVTEHDDAGVLVHFVYVKPRWRKLGAARLLLRPFLGRRVEFTHATRMLRLLPVPKDWSFNPYPFLRATQEKT